MTSPFGDVHESVDQRTVVLTAMISLVSWSLDREPAPDEGAGPRPSEEIQRVEREIEDLPDVISAELEYLDDVTSGQQIRGSIEMEPQGGIEPLEDLDAAYAITWTFRS